MRHDTIATEASQLQIFWGIESRLEVIHPARPFSMGRGVTMVDQFLSTACSKECDHVK